MLDCGAVVVVIRRCRAAVSLSRITMPSINYKTKIAQIWMPVLVICSAAISRIQKKMRPGDLA